MNRKVPAGYFSLTPIQARLVDELFIDPSDPKAAALRAGYAPSVVSKALSHPTVQKVLDRFRMEQANRTKITADRVLEEVARVAFASLKDITSLDELGNTTIDLKKLSREDASALKEITIRTVKGSGTKEVQDIKISLVDKMAALQLLCKHLGLSTEKVEVSGKLSLLDLVEASLKKSEAKSETQVKAEAVEVKE